MAKFKLITGKKIQEMIDSIGKRGKQLDHDVQRTACSIVQHVNQYHEVSLANNLIGALGKGMRANALRDWFDTHLKATFNEEKQVFEQAPKGTALSDMPSVVAAKAWYDHKIEKGFIPTDHSKVVAQLIKKMQADLALTDPEKVKVVKATPEAVRVLMDAAKLLGIEVADAPAAPDETPDEVVDPLANIV
jgi:hypothetical protein